MANYINEEKRYERPRPPLRSSRCVGLRPCTARDLSLLLDRGLSGRQVIALRRAEAQTLERLAGDLGLEMIADDIAALPGSVAYVPASGHWSLSRHETASDSR